MLVKQIQYATEIHISRREIRYRGSCSKSVVDVIKFGPPFLFAHASHRHPSLLLNLLP